MPGGFNDKSLFYYMVTDAYILPDTGIWLRHIPTYYQHCFFRNFSEDASANRGMIINSSEV